jgi:hypothetical protein
MEFITDIFSIGCDSCGKSFPSGATGKTKPYDDYSCTKCNWKATLCSNCVTKGCSKCGGILKSTHERMSDSSGGNVLF